MTDHRTQTNAPLARDIALAGRFAVQPGLLVIDTTQQYISEAAASTGMVINPTAWC